MNKRGVFIGFGSVLLVFGLAGLALVQTGILPVIPNPPGRLTEQTLPVPAPPEAASPQSGTEGQKLSEPVTPKEPQPETQTERPLAPPVVGKGERRFPAQNQLAEAPPVEPRKQPQAERQAAAPQLSKSHAGQEKRGPGQVVTIRFRFDPSRDRNLKLATVHYGDRVVVSIRRVGQPDARLYLSFNMAESFRSSASPYNSRRSEREGTVMTPIKDEDELVLTAERQFGPFLTRQLDSKDGAVLRLTAQDPPARSRPPRYDRGFYEIQMKIYAENRWDIKPRSFL